MSFDIVKRDKNVLKSVRISPTSAVMLERLMKAYKVNASVIVEGLLLSYGEAALNEAEVTAEGTG